MTETKKKTSNLMAIKKYFGMTLEEAKTELKALTESDREELGKLARIELGEEA